MKTLTSFVLLTALLGVAPAALAAPTTTPAEAARATRTTIRLAPETARSLRAAVATARANDPGAFREVAQLVARTPELDRKARGGKAPIAVSLAGMGPRAVMPLVEMAAFTTASVPEVARLDVVEALGILRDARATSVLLAWLDQADVIAAPVAAEAVARLDTDEAADALVAALAKSEGARARAILAGMGMCHRPKVAKALADRLASASDEETARVVMRSLRRVASPWAWSTLARRDDESAVRDLASQALVDAFVRWDGETRTGAEKALVVVDDGRVARFVQTARDRVSPDERVALDGLAARLSAARTAPRR